MSKIVWDEIGKKTYHTGVDRGVLYTQVDGKYAKGVGWNGLTGVNESPSGAEETPLWANNAKYGSLYSAEEFGFTITAYQSPEEFDACDGTLEIFPGVSITQQDRASFGFTYRNLVGNDTEKNAYGYDIHLVYGATATPSEKDHCTVNESPEAEELSWECSTVPVPVSGKKPTAHIVIHSNRMTTPEAKAKLAKLEDILYGTDNAEPRLPLPDEVKTLLTVGAVTG
jgi:hypothetical protein